MRHSTMISLSLALTVALSGCVPEPAPEVTLESNLLLARGQCGSTQPEARITPIDTEAALAATYQRLFAHQLGDIPAPPSIDFNAQRVLLIEMGQRNTAGYALLPADYAVRVADATAQINLIWKEPPPDAMVAQVITSPCLLLELPRGDYRRVVVLDQESQVRAELALDE